MDHAKLHRECQREFSFAPGLFKALEDFLLRNRNLPVDDVFAKNGKMSAAAVITGMVFEFLLQIVGNSLKDTVHVLESNHLIVVV